MKVFPLIILIILGGFFGYVILYKIGESLSLRDSGIFRKMETSHDLYFREEEGPHVSGF